MEENLRKNENTMLKANKNTNVNKNSIIAILIVIIIVLFGMVVYFVLIKQSSKLGKLEVYCEKNYDDCWLTTISSEGKELFYTIETETANPKVVGGNYDIVLFDDNGLKVFTEKDKSIKKINLENKYSSYDVVSSNGSLVGVVYKGDNTSGYYDNKTNKTLYDEGTLLNDAYNEKYILYLNNNKISIYDKVNSKVLKENINLENKYTEYRVLSEMEVNEKGVGTEKKLVGIFAVNKSNGGSIYYNLEKNKTMYKDSYSNMYLDENNDYLIAQKDLNTGANYDTIDYILDSTEEKIVFEPSNTKKHMSFHLEKYNGKYYFIESTNLVEPHYYTKGIIYSNEKKLIAEINYYPGDYKGQDYMITNQGELFIKKENTLSKFNIDGELLNSKIYEKVINIDSGYLIVVNDGKLVIENSNFKELAKVIEWKDSYKLDKYPPLYLNEDSFSEESSSNFISGIYMVLEDGKNYTEYCFNPKDNKITSRKIDNLDNYDLSIYWADLS